ncbi:MAG: hypothetical protein ACFFCZ_18450 [Promethearchaeota archaeon]
MMFCQWSLVHITGRHEEGNERYPKRESTGDGLKGLENELKQEKLDARGGKRKWVLKEFQRMKQTIFSGA